MFGPAPPQTAKFGEFATIVREWRNRSGFKSAAAGVGLHQWQSGETHE
jgi:hypothetical protein